MQELYVLSLYHNGIDDFSELSHSPYLPIISSNKISSLIDYMKKNYHETYDFYDYTVNEIINKLKEDKDNNFNWYYDDVKNDYNSKEEAYKEYSSDITNLYNSYVNIGVSKDENESTQIRISKLPFLPSKPSTGGGKKKTRKNMI